MSFLIKDLELPLIDMEFVLHVIMLILKDTKLIGRKREEQLLRLLDKHRSKTNK